MNATSFAVVPRIRASVAFNVAGSVIVVVTEGLAPSTRVAFFAAHVAGGDDAEFVVDGGETAGPLMLPGE